MKTMLRFPLAQTAAVMLAVISSAASLMADDPAENAVKSDVEKIKADLELSVQNAYELQYTRLATSAAGFIGVEVSPPDDVLRSHLGLAEGKGLVVTSVTEGGPAAQAGIQVNDVLVSVGDEEFDGVEKLRQLLEASQDKPVSIGFIRGGQRQKVEVTPHVATAAAVQNYLRLNVLAGAEGPKYWLGVGLAGADDALRSHLGVAAGEGLVVTGVDSNTPAAKAGLMTNDLLVKLDGKPLKTIEELSAQLQEIKDKPVALELLRRGKPASLTVTPELRPQGEALLRWFVPSGVVVERTPEQAIYFTDPHSAKLAFESNDAGSLFASQLLAAAVHQPAAHTALAAQAQALAEQAKQLQAAIETLQATINAQGQPPKSEEPGK